MEPLLYRRPDLAWPALRPLVMSGKVASLTAWCREHNQFCAAQEAESTQAGLPCPQWSSQCSDAKDIGDASTALVAAVWISHRRSLCEKFINYENVFGKVLSGHYPMRFIHDHLEDLYWPCTLPSDNELLGNPAIIGCPMRSATFGGWTVRDRDYLNMRNRATSLADIPPLARFSRRFCSSVPELMDSRSVDALVR